MRVAADRVEAWAGPAKAGLAPTVQSVWRSKARKRSSNAVSLGTGKGPRNGGRAAWNAWSGRKRRERTRPGRKKSGRQAIQRPPAGEMPPPRTMQCGWVVLAQIRASMRRRDIE